MMKHLRFRVSAVGDKLERSLQEFFPDKKSAEEAFYRMAEKCPPGTKIAAIESVENEWLSAVVKSTPQSKPESQD